APEGGANIAPPEQKDACNRGAKIAPPEQNPRATGCTGGGATGVARGGCNSSCTGGVQQAAPEPSFTSFTSLEPSSPPNPPLPGGASADFSFQENSGQGNSGQARPE